MCKFKSSQTSKKVVNIFVDNEELVLPVELLQNIADDEIPRYLLSNNFDISYENKQIESIEMVAADHSDSN